MYLILNYDAEAQEMTFQCDCGEVITEDTSSFNSTYREDIGGFENFSIYCENCNGLNFIAMTIPLHEKEEPEGVVELMSPETIESRKHVRDFIWDKRQDLQEVDREEYNKQFE